MKKLLLVIAAILVIGCNPVSADDWSREDTLRQAGYTALHLARWSQARDNRPSELYLPEEATMYGPAPMSAYETRKVGRGDINKEYAMSLALHYTVARLLPEDYRKVFQYVTIAVQGHNVVNEQVTNFSFTMPF